MKKLNENKMHNDIIHIEKKDNVSLSNYNEDNNNIQNEVIKKFLLYNCKYILHA